MGVRCGARLNCSDLIRVAGRERGGITEVRPVGAILPGQRGTDYVPHLLPRAWAAYAASSTEPPPPNSSTRKD